MSKKQEVKGVIVPVITPVDKKENVDEAAFRAVIKRCLDAGVDGIFVGGSAGMGPLLTDGQWQRAAEIARDEVSAKHILLGGGICTSTKIAVEKIKFLEKTGYQHVAVTPTYYITIRNDEQFIRHFGACRQASDMNMVVYNIPSCTYSQIPLNVLEKMAAENWFKSIKESSGDKAYFEGVMKLAKKYKLIALQGNEPDIAWGLTIGAKGIVPVCANYEPQTYVTAVKAAKAKDKALLDKAQERASFIREEILVKSENWIAGIMCALSTLGIGSGIPVEPLCKVSAKSKKRISALKVTDIA